MCRCSCCVCGVLLVLGCEGLICILLGGGGGGDGERERQQEVFPPVGVPVLVKCVLLCGAWCVWCVCVLVLRCSGVRV